MCLDYFLHIDEGVEKYYTFTVNKNAKISKFGAFPREEDMKFFYGKQQFSDLNRAQEANFLLTNGLGGYASVTGGFSVNRCDMGILVAAEKAPNVRITLVHRMQEVLEIGGKEYWLSTQEFADGSEPENGYRNQTGFSYETEPCWTYEVAGVSVKRTCVMDFEKNTTAVLYEVTNRSGLPCSIKTVPFCKFAPKEQALEEEKTFTFKNNTVTDGNYTMYIHTDGALAETEALWQNLAYPEDAKDGRPEEGMAGAVCAVTFDVKAGENAAFQLIFSMDAKTPDAAEILKAHRARMAQLLKDANLADPLARQLVLAADAYIARRDSTNGKTILAGYPLFSDWGRDTMIALPGCCLATGRYEDAKSILRTFLAYEKDGLVPNLFPEGEAKPMYNTVDAALLLIDTVYQYLLRTGDWDFVQEAYPVLERIITGYRKGTHHHIKMEEDGLISAGGGLDQVTWMDVCVQGILPTPRHGKPVEINAYWYNALRIMDIFAEKLGFDRKDYLDLAEQVKVSFQKNFYLEKKGYLKDVVSGTKADEQLRCNQIWAVSMPFGMLTAEQEKQVVDAVCRHLHTPCGLRTLSPEDPEYKGFYGGSMIKRDMAYHQGTTWVFPMGAYYLAYLKVTGNTEEAKADVREQLEAMEAMMRQGCAGQLPEIYDGDFPSEGKGCFGQAWSVGEMLRVFETIEK